MTRREEMEEVTKVKKTMHDNKINPNHFHVLFIRPRCNVLNNLDVKEWKVESRRVNE